MSIIIEVNDREIIAALDRLRERCSESGMRRALAAIGEGLAESTRQRFAASRAPDGSAWAPNAESTLLRVMRKSAKGARLKNGGKGARGHTMAAALKALAGKKPLVATSQLATTIRHQLIPGGVLVGTDRFAGKFEGGAAVHQFGSRDGRIPARPFLGLSTADREMVLGIIARHFGGWEPTEALPPDRASGAAA